MPHNPDYSAQITGYVDPAHVRRMKRLQKARPRLTISRQIDECLKIGLPLLEAQHKHKPSTCTPS